MSFFVERSSGKIVGLYTMLQPGRAEEERPGDDAGVVAFQQAVDDLFSPPDAPSLSISRRQLLLGLTAMGLITGEEALAAAQTGAVPAAIDAFFAQLPGEQALAARITWASMSVAERDNPLVAALAAANNLSMEDVDAAFLAWAQL